MGLDWESLDWSKYEEKLSQEQMQVLKFFSRRYFYFTNVKHWDEIMIEIIRNAKKRGIKIPGEDLKELTGFFYGLREYNTKLQSYILSQNLKREKMSFQQQKEVGVEDIRVQICEVLQNKQNYTEKIWHQIDYENMPQDPEIKDKKFKDFIIEMRYLPLS